MIDFGEHVPEKKGFDLTPMIDVVFLLLIFFLLTSIFSKPSLPLDLPQAETATLEREPAHSVTVKADGSLFLDGREVTHALLFTELSASYDRGGRREISLHSDRGVPFGKVVEVMDIAKKAGAEDISVVAEKKK